MEGLNQKTFEVAPTSETEPENFIREKARELEPQMRKWYGNIHEEPELGGEEFATAERVKRFLEEEQIEIVGEGIGGTGIVARIRGQKSDRTIALRADMDALPIQENEEHTPCSKHPGIMHACGHDAHTAGLMGGAKILQVLAKEGKLDGDVLLLFQPSEEKAHQKESGAVKIVRFLEKNGLRDNVQAFFGLHVYRENERGVVTVKDGVQSASSGEVDIVLRAPGGHIKNAYELPNLNVIASEITTRLADMFEPLAKKQEALVASGRTKYEGSGYNVLPARSESPWVIRVASERHKEISREILEQIKQVVEEVVAKHSQAGKVGVELKRRPGYRPIVHRDLDVVETARQAVRETVENCQFKDTLYLGGEDFSFYLEELRGKEIPGVFLLVGAANSEKGIRPGPHHASDFEIDQSVLAELAALHATFVNNAFKELK